MISNRGLMMHGVTSYAQLCASITSLEFIRNYALQIATIITTSTSFADIKLNKHGKLKSRAGYYLKTCNKQNYKK